MQNTSTIETLEHVNCRRSGAKRKLPPELKQMAGERPANLLRYVLVPKPPLCSEIGRVCRVNACCLLAGWLASTLATVGAVTFIERSITSSVTCAWPGSCFWECGSAGVGSSSQGWGQAERAT